jgi:hypothetical protein
MVSWESAYTNTTETYASISLIQQVRTVFDALDCDGKLALDVHEVGLFWRYVFMSLFDVELAKDQQEALFHLLDMVHKTKYICLIGLLSATRRIPFLFVMCTHIFS